MLFNVACVVYNILILYIILSYWLYWYIDIYGTRNIRNLTFLGQRRARWLPKSMWQQNGYQPQAGNLGMLPPEIQPQPSCLAQNAQRAIQMAPTMNGMSYGPFVPPPPSFLAFLQSNSQMMHNTIPMYMPGRVQRLPYVQQQVSGDTSQGASGQTDETTTQVKPKLEPMSGQNSYNSEKQPLDSQPKSTRTENMNGNWLTHVAIEGVKMQLLTRFFGCYWRNKYSHLVGFPEVYPTGQDYETWILERGSQDAKKHRGADIDVSSSISPTKSETTKSDENTQAKIPGKIKPVYTGGRRGRSYPSPIEVVINIPLSVLPTNGGAQLCFYAHISRLDKLPESDESLLGKPLSEKDIDRIMGADRYVVQNSDTNVKLSGFERSFDESLNPTQGKGLYQISATFSPSHWVYSERVSNANNKSGFTHHPHTCSNPLTSSTRRCFTTLRIISFVVKSGTATDSKNPGDYVYTPIAVLRSPAFAVGATRTIRRKRQQKDEFDLGLDSKPKCNAKKVKRRRKPAKKSTKPRKSRKVRQSAEALEDVHQENGFVHEGLDVLAQAAAQNNKTHMD